MKKVNENELRVLFSVIVNKISEERFRSVEKDLKKDKDWKRMESLDVEMREWNLKLSKMNLEWSELSSRIVSKYGVNVMKGSRSGELKGWFVNEFGNGMGINSGLWNDLVVMNLGEENVEKMIERMVKKWSK